ncbi:MAG: hypothetical protein KIT13_06385 [Burkholderiales bacterium]|nr:hypothetical protein [Burkholderiales bacterium]
MNTSTATQSNTSTDQQFPQGFADVDKFIASASSTPPKSTPTSPNIEFPEFRDTAASVSAHAARTAARLNASKISDEEYQAWRKERQELVKKEVAGTLTRREETRLSYVRWSLDRIEDARHGEDLDRLEERISRYESFLNKLDNFRESLERVRLQRR